MLGFFAGNFVVRGFKVGSIMTAATANRFVVPAAAACVSLAMGYAAQASGLTAVPQLPWSSVGRIASTALMVLVFGGLHGAHMVELLPACSFAVGAWVQLAAASTLPSQWLRCVLFLSGVANGAGAIYFLRSFSHSGKLVEEKPLRNSVDLSAACGVCYALAWLMSEFAGHAETTGNLLGIAMNGCIDLLFVAGCGHLALKQPATLNSIMEGMIERTQHS